MNSLPCFDLYSFHPQKKIEELIAKINILNIQEFEFPPNLIISHYNKDIISTSNPEPITISSNDEQGENKLKNFAKYLFDRKKSAVINLPDSNLFCHRKLFILPPIANDDLRLLCTTRETPKVQTKPKSETLVPESKPVNESNSIQTRKRAPAPVGFLSSLLSLSSSMATERMAVQTNLLQKQAEKDSENEILEAFERDVRKRLLVFDHLDDGEAVEVEFEPTEKANRSIIHKVVESYEAAQIVSVSTGEEELRHVLVTRRGLESQRFLQAQEEERVRHEIVGKISVVKGAGRKKNPVPFLCNQILEPETQPSFGKEETKKLHLVNVSSTKRDRRTIEEIQDDMRKKKQIC